MAAEFYTRQHAKIAIGKILQASGWHSANATPLHVLTDLLEDYVKKIGTATVKYANECGFAQPNLEHLGFVFLDFHINLEDILNNCENTKFEKCNKLPQFPLPKEDQLNFLDPGSAEAATRPAHIHDHLPPMPKVVLPTNQKTAQQPQRPLDSEEHLFKNLLGVAPVRRPVKRPREKISVKRLKATRGAVRCRQCRY